jgi:DNA-binding transcriptional LysR family regulator
MSDGGQLLVLPALLAELAARAPGITVAVRAPAPDAARRLAAGELDLALGRATGEATGLYRQTLIEDHLSLVVRRTPRAPRLRLPEIARRGLVRIEGRGGDQLAQALAAHRPPPTVTVHSLLAGVMVVIRSERVLVTGAETAFALSRALPIRACDPPTELGGVTISQQWHARLHADPAHVWLRQLVKQLCDRRAWRAASPAS